MSSSCDVTTTCSVVSVPGVPVADGAGDAAGLAAADVASWAVDTCASQINAPAALKNFFIDFFQAKVSKDRFHGVHELREAKRTPMRDDL